MEVIEEFGRGGPRSLDDHGNDRVPESIPATLEAYVVTRAHDPARAVEKLVRRYSRTGLWTVITAPLAASVDMMPCRFGASLMLRRFDGLLSAGIVAGNWSVTVLGDEVWVDVVSSTAVAVGLVGAPVRTKIEIPFLPPTLRVCGAQQIGAYYRFHCK